MRNYIYTPKTELHTHIIEILDFKDFFDFLMDYNISIPLKNKVIDFENGIDMNINDIKSNQELYDSVLSQLSINKDIVGDFSMLNDITVTRCFLVGLCAKTYECYNDNYDYALSLAMYSLLKRSLESLKNMGIMYAEISYSNIRVINNIEQLIKEDENKIDGIKYKILIGINRNKGVSDFRKASKKIKDLSTSDSICGCDIFGYERPIDMTEKSIYASKIYYLLEAIKSHNETNTLRIHSGEFSGKNNMLNTEMLLSNLDRIEREKRIEVLPTEIRIGHGINMDRTSSLSELLKRYKVIVEFNITSNHRLGNVTPLQNDIYKRILDYYIDNSIEVVLSTDGNGVYSTSPYEEAIIAQELVGDRIEYLRQSDENIYKRKLNLQQK